ncbi:metallophosphoesterase [Catelliglobosispora koreensis]|uniref:metallophosphoesterase n=1 Tax=Catelliglobosispora koreensis TaxID=129052 RepID=UPI00037956FE|nr:metallophosphoesterase [Catelliglobosispora koreensis]
MSASEAVQAPPARQSLRLLIFPVFLIGVAGLLFGVPWWTLIGAPDWPAPVEVLGGLIFGGAAIAMPVMMFYGHGRRRDWAARIGDTTLGVIWVFFTWSVIASIGKLVLNFAGVENAARGVALAVVTVASGLVVWGYVEAMRVPRVKRVDITLPRLGRGLDGTKIVLLTDTHYGPIDRAKWSARVTEAVNELDADIVCHTGDIADGTAVQRREQAAPLGDIKAKLTRAYVTGNHEYFGDAQGWLDYMQEMGWEQLHNRHLTVQRGGDTLVIAGVDDYTAAHTGTGHSQDHAAALAGADPELPVLLLAHQPKQIPQAVAHGIDLQISGHTHGGQIWPFNLFVKLDQPSVAGLSRHGERTQLYTSRGTGFWGPPLRVFAPSEITLITLRAE